MSAIADVCVPQKAEGPQGPSPNLSGYARLGLILLSLVFFIYVLAPWGLQLPYFKTIAKVIEEEGIEANAYYYTEVPEFSDAYFHMRTHVK